MFKIKISFLAEKNHIPHISPWS